MKPVEQTFLTYPEGNCFAACVASVLELPLEAVPDFKGEGWFDRWQEWLANYNLTFINFRVDPDDSWRPPGYSLLAADSPRGAWLHSVVCRDGEIVFDPHPERYMGVGKWQEWTSFIVLDPSKPVRVAQNSTESR